MIVQPSDALDNRHVSNWCLRPSPFPSTGTSRRRTGYPWWTSTKSINGSKPNCACWRCSSASRIPRSLSRARRRREATLLPSIHLTEGPPSHHGLTCHPYMAPPLSTILLPAPLRDGTASTVSHYCLPKTTHQILPSPANVQCRLLSKDSDEETSSSHQSRLDTFLSTCFIQRNSLFLFRV